MGKGKSLLIQIEAVSEQGVILNCVQCNKQIYRVDQAETKNTNVNANTGESEGQHPLQSQTNNNFAKSASTSTFNFLPGVYVKSQYNRKGSTQVRIYCQECFQELNYFLKQNKSHKIIESSQTSIQKRPKLKAKSSLLHQREKRISQLETQIERHQSQLQNYVYMVRQLSSENQKLHCKTPQEQEKEKQEQKQQQKNNEPIQYNYNDLIQQKYLNGFIEIANNYKKISKSLKKYQHKFTQFHQHIKQKLQQYLQQQYFQTAQQLEHSLQQQKSLIQQQIQSIAQLQKNTISAMRSLRSTKQDGSVFKQNSIDTVEGVFQQQIRANQAIQSTICQYIVECSGVKQKWDSRKQVQCNQKQQQPVIFYQQMSKQIQDSKIEQPQNNQIVSQSQYKEQQKQKLTTADSLPSTSTLIATTNIKKQQQQQQQQQANQIQPNKQPQHQNQNNSQTQTKIQQITDNSNNHNHNHNNNANYQYEHEHEQKQQVQKPEQIKIKNKNKNKIKNKNKNKNKNKYNL